MMRWRVALTVVVAVILMTPGGGVGAQESMVPNTFPSAAAVDFSNAYPHGDAEWNFALHSIDGACAAGGDTEHLIECVADKYGIPVRLFKGQAWEESSWKTDAQGDWTTNTTWCPYPYDRDPILSRHGGRCPQSFGLFQVKVRYWPGGHSQVANNESWPWVRDSAGFNAELAGLQLWGAYTGHHPWLGDCAGSWRCAFNSWFTGEVNTSDTYFDRVRWAANARAWE